MRVCEWISGQERGWVRGYVQTISLRGCRCSAARLHSRARFASQRGVRIGLHEFWHWPHRSSFPAGEREMIPRNGSGPIKWEELVPIRRGNGPRGVGPAGPCFASAPLPVHDAPASGPGDPTVSAIAGRKPSQPDLGGRSRRIARESRWDRQRAVFDSLLVRK